MFGAFKDALVSEGGGLSSTEWPASSNIIIEVAKDKTASTYVNDVKLLTKCNQLDCPIAEFIDSLTKRTNEQTKAVCLESAKDLDFIQQ